jgi:hypothetical protein
MTKISPTCARLALTAALLGFAPGVYAYLDPSTGSMILSAIVGIFATLSLAIKTYWYKLKAFFSGNKTGEESGEAGSDNPQRPGDESS